MLAGSALGAALALGCSNAEPPADTDPDVVANQYRAMTERINNRTGARQISVAELRSVIDGAGRAVLIDVRAPDERQVSVLPGAIAAEPEVPRVDVALLEDAVVVVYCTAGHRSGLAAVALERRLERPVHSLDGGMIQWFNEGGAVVTPDGGRADRIHPHSDDWARFIRRRKTEP
ncbi:MAG: hypothetical protein CMJ18_11440 [Phycisphaeraceae bacterium]|nr:hypothetical protein [Phycisphaeraceae bacterium]